MSQSLDMEITYLHNLAKGISCYKAKELLNDIIETVVNYGLPIPVMESLLLKDTENKS